MLWFFLQSRLASSNPVVERVLPREGNRLDKLVQDILPRRQYLRVMIDRVASPDLHRVNIKGRFQIQYNSLPFYQLSTPPRNGCRVSVHRVPRLQES